MRLLKYLVEKWQFTLKDKWTKMPIEVFANPTKSDYKDVLGTTVGFNKDKFRFVADPNKKLLYIFDPDALHADIVSKISGQRKNYGNLYTGVGMYEGSKSRMAFGAVWSMYEPRDILEMAKMDWGWLSKWFSNWKYALDDIASGAGHARMRLGEAKVIDINPQLKIKKGQDFRKKIIGSFYKEKGKQLEIETELRKKVEEIKKKSKTNLSKFKYPTVLSDFKKGINPVEAIWLASGFSKEPQDMIEKFSREVAKKHKKEILKILEDDLKKFQELLPRAEDAIAPQYAKQIVMTPIHFTKRLIDFYKDI